jgi:predicted RNA-binding protein YlxR (DUF448 family)
MSIGTQDVASAIDLDRGPRAAERTRMCALTREICPISELIRFVVGPDGTTVPDLRTKLPGRGLWLTGSRAALAEAIKRKIFSRGFKREVRVPADLAEQTERLLERAILDALAMAGKAGRVAAGFSKAQTALEREQVIALVHAADAAPDGVRKLQATAQRQRSGPPPEIGILTTAQLDLALNRPNVVHAALLAGPASETFLARCRRLERFRTGDQHHQAGKAAPRNTGRRHERV